MKAADIMKRDVVTIRPDAALAEAIKLMLDHHASGLPVIDRAGAVVGIVTEGDLLRRSETETERKRPRWLEFLIGSGRLADEYVRAHGRKVEEVMTSGVISTTPSSSLESVVELLEKYHIKRVPVIENGRLVGIVSRADLLSVIARANVSNRTGSDLEIRRRLLAEIDAHPWALSGCADALVKDGVVELRGIIHDDRQRGALQAAAENIPGVKQVVDHLVWIEPISGTVVDAPGMS